MNIERNYTLEHRGSGKDLKESLTHIRPIVRDYLDATKEYNKMKDKIDKYRGVQQIIGVGIYVGLLIGIAIEAIELVESMHTIIYMMLNSITVILCIVVTVAFIAIIYLQIKRIQEKKNLKTYSIKFNNINPSLKHMLEFSSGKTVEDLDTPLHEYGRLLNMDARLAAYMQYINQVEKIFREDFDTVQFHIPSSGPLRKTIEEQTTSLSYEYPYIMIEHQDTFYALSIESNRKSVLDVNGYPTPSKPYPDDFRFYEYNTDKNTFEEVDQTVKLSKNVKTIDQKNDRPKTLRHLSYIPEIIEYVPYKDILDILRETNRNNEAETETDDTWSDF